MKPTREDIRRRLGLREVPKPPEDLARRIKADIPASFRYREHFPAGRKVDGAAAAFWGLSWQVAASFLALTVVGVGIYMTTFESQKAETASTIAEADGRSAMEYAPPSAAPASPQAREKEASIAESRQADAASHDSYDLAAAPPPPPPPPPRAQSAAGAVEGGVEGGVLGGVIGGVLGSAATASDDDVANKPAEAQTARSRDEGFAEEKLSAAAAAAPAPVSIAEPGRRDAKGERAVGAGVAQPTTMAAVAPSAQNEVLGKERDGRDTPLRVGGNVKAPVVIKRVEIVYPEAAIEARVQGIVIIEAVIDRNGDVRDARVLKSLPLGLDAAAVRAIKQWKFKPGTVDGKPVDVIFNLTVNAKLAR
ncbi:MAG: energy transducer TonB [Thermoanaerobaculia bacterium]